MPHTLTPHLIVRDAARAAEWYATALGAEELSRIPLPGGKLMSVELRFGDSTVVLADEFPELGAVSPLTLGGTYGSLHLLVDGTTDDVDALWQRALDAGAEVFVPLADTFWGERFGQILDPFGHRWALAQHLRDVPPDEVAKAAAAAFGNEATGQ